jgi:hypothetical protein
VNLDGDGDVDLERPSLTGVYEQSPPQAGDRVRMLSFQRLDVYQRAIEVLALVYDIVADLPRGIAEGAGRWSEADSANR